MTHKLPEFHFQPGKGKKKRKFEFSLTQPGAPSGRRFETVVTRHELKMKRMTTYMY